MSHLLPSTGEPDDLNLTAADAEWLRAEALAHRAAAAAIPNPLSRATSLARASALEDVAGKVNGGLARRPALRPHQRRGGGALRADSDHPWPRQEIARATRSSPDLLDAEASLERLGLARAAGALTLAVDAAEGTGAVTPAEQMLAHQLAAAHALAMRMAAKAGAFAARKFVIYQSNLAYGAEESKREQVASIEAARCATAAARMMEATARAAVALDRLRNGNRQTVVVQYVEVKEGEQAVVGGTVGVTPSRRRPGGARE